MDTKVFLADGEAVRLVFGVKAVKLGTFSNDTSAAQGTTGFTLPVLAIGYDIAATGGVPVRFHSRYA